MTNERDRRILEALERATRAEDPAFARRMSGAGPWSGWRKAVRRLTTLPAIILAIVLAIAAFAINVSALGNLFLLWAICGAVIYLRRRSGAGGGPQAPVAGRAGHRTD